MKKLHIRFLVVAILWSVLYYGCRQLSPIEKQTGGFSYSVARKDSVVDVYHGTKVPDPYRWLEDPDSTETQNWVAKQNELSSNFISSIPVRKKIKIRLKDLMNYPRYSSPYKRGGRYFFWKNDGLQNQSVLYTKQTLDDKPAVVINPNLLSRDGTVAVSTTAVSENGRLLAYGISRSGSDRQEIKIRTIGSGIDYEETIKWCRFTSIAWKHDHSGFFYNRFPDPNTVSLEDQTNYSRVY